MYKSSSDLDGIRSEAHYMAHLGLKVCPPVLQLTPDGYIMPMMIEISGDASLLQSIVSLLQQEVWCHAPIDHDERWVTAFAERFGFIPPKYIYEEKPVRTHGDPTAANAMMTDRGQLRLIDPKPPGRGIPSFMSVDLGKVIQSAMGWESVIAQNPPIAYTTFLNSSTTLEIARAIWWARIHMLRIAQREPSQSYIKDWALQSAEELQRLL